MARRIKSKATKRDWRWYAYQIFGGLVALSMVVGTILSFTGASLQRGNAAPTFAVPTAAPTLPDAVPTLPPQATRTP
jgi:hypothetical protein